MSSCKVPVKMIHVQSVLMQRSLFKVSSCKRSPCKVPQCGSPVLCEAAALVQSPRAAPHGVAPRAASRRAVPCRRATRRPRAKPPCKAAVQRLRAVPVVQREAASSCNAPRATRPPRGKSHPRAKPLCKAPPSHVALVHGPSCKAACASSP